MKEFSYKYQSEYMNSKCFWGKQPSKYVRLLADILNHRFGGLKVADIGAGEGKNSVYMASLGANVFSVDISYLALTRFHLQPNYRKSWRSIQRISMDVNHLYLPSNSFDVVIAYGLLHCLRNSNEVQGLVSQIIDWIKPSGYFVGCAFNNEIPPPEVQLYLDFESFLKKGELREFFHGWQILAYEDEIITESHPTTKIEHQHSLSRIIAQKNDHI